MSLALLTASIAMAAPGVPVLIHEARPEAPKQGAE
jgi:hypothetical protein